MWALPLAGGRPSPQGSGTISTVPPAPVMAAGAVLAEGTIVPPGSLVMGMPGKVVRAVDQVLRSRIEHTWRHYMVLGQRHRSGAFPVWPAAGA